VNSTLRQGFVTELVKLAGLKPNLKAMSLDERLNHLLVQAERGAKKRVKAIKAGARSAEQRVDKKAARWVRKHTGGGTP